MSERQEKAITFAIERRFGQSADARNAAAEANALFSDWEGDCGRCGTHLRGTLAEIRTHRCPDVSPS